MNQTKKNLVNQKIQKKVAIKYNIANEEDFYTKNFINWSYGRLFASYNANKYYN